MLSEKMIRATVPLATKLADKGLRVVAKPNTVIERLNAQIKTASVSNGMDIATMQDEDLLNMIITSIENHSTGTYTKDSINPSMHDMHLGEYVDTFSNYVRSHIAYAKNVVGPVATTLSNRIKAYLQDYATRDAKDAIDIVRYKLPEILQDEMFVDQLKHMTGKAAIPPEKFVHFEGRAPKEISDLLLTSDTGYNAAILPWSTHLKEGFVLRIWDSFFSKASGNPEYSFNDLMALPINERLDAALVIYLICNTLGNKVETTADNYSLSDYKRYMLQLQDMAASIILGCMKSFDLYAKTSTMVLNISVNRKCVVVFAQVYDAWLQNGGSPEVLLGMVVGNRDINNAKAISENAENFKKAWASFQTFYKATEGNTMMQRFKEMLLTQFELAIYENKDALAEYSTAHPSYALKSKELFEDYIGTLTYKDIEDPNKVALHLAGRCVFYFTDSYKLLESIEEVYATNKNADIREAALVASIVYITDYVLDQLTVTK